MKAVYEVRIQYDSLSFAYSLADLAVNDEAHLISLPLQEDKDVQR